MSSRSGQRNQTTRSSSDGDDSRHHYKGKRRDGTSRRKKAKDAERSNSSSDTLTRIFAGASALGHLARSSFQSGSSNPRRWTRAMQELEYAKRQSAFHVGSERSSLLQFVEIEELEKDIKRAITVLELANLVLLFRPMAVETAWVRITVPVEGRADEQNTQMIEGFLNKHLEYDPEFFTLWTVLPVGSEEVEPSLDAFVRVEYSDQHDVVTAANEMYDWIAMPIPEPSPIEIEQIVGYHEHALGKHFTPTTECIFTCGHPPMQLLDWIEHFLEGHVKIADGLQPGSPLSCPWCKYNLMDWNHIATHLYAHLRLEDAGSSWDEGWRRKAVWEYIYSVQRVLPTHPDERLLDYVPPPWPASHPQWEWVDVKAKLDDESTLEEERILGQIDLTIPNSLPEIVFNLLSPRLRDSLCFRDAAWTVYTNPSTVSPIPISIANCLVILPVFTPHPRHSIQAPNLPDPHGDKILDPRTVLSDLSLHRLLEVFPFANAFYVLFNGMLQIWVDDDFDFRWAARELPRTFGGLVVSYFNNAPELTSGRTSKTNPQVTWYESGSSGSATPVPSTTQGARVAPAKPVQPVECGRGIEIVGPEGRGPPIKACMGVALELSNPREPADKQVVVTVSSHAVLAARISQRERRSRASGKQPEGERSSRNHLKKISDIDSAASSLSSSARESRRGKRSAPSPWWANTHVYASGTHAHIGTVHSTYDPNIYSACQFPVNYSHDLSLLLPQHTVPLSSLASPAKHWYPHRIVDPNSSIFVLGPHGPIVAGKHSSIPQRWGASIGTGYLVRQRRSQYPTRDEVTNGTKTLDESISRCVLWRPMDMWVDWEGWSGAPVFVCEKGTYWLLGFMGFVQRAEEGRGGVVMAGCIFPPKELAEARIL